MTQPLAEITVAVLAGGLGTRIRGVLGDTPKVLAPIHGRPFLDHLLDWLAGQGACRVVLCLGHRAEQVTAHLANRPDRGLWLETVIEDNPLGTAGALRLAGPRLGQGPVLVINGDTWLDTDLAAFTRRHQESGAGISLLCVRVDDARRYGRVELDSRNRVRAFREKDPDHDGPGIVSAGMVLLAPALVQRLLSAHGPSLEVDFLQTLPPATIRADVVAGMFIDIGTPESLRQAPQVIIGAPESPGH